MISLRTSAAVMLLPLSIIACNLGSKDRAAANAALSERKEVATEQKSPPPGDYYLAAVTDSTAQVAGNDNKPPQSPRQAQSAPPPNIDWDKKVIKNAALTIEIANYKNFNDLVHNNVKKWGGYVAQEEQNESDYKIENILTIKVPVAQFESAVSDLVPEKEKVISKKITSEDVTGEVVDTRSRMEAKRQVRQRYLDLLKQAKNMEEILQVQDVINNTQVEIESAAGRVNYLTHAAAYSTIQLTFYQVLNEQAEHRDQPSFGTRILGSLESGLLWVGELLVLLLTLWPVWIALGITVWALNRYRKTRVITKSAESK